MTHRDLDMSQLWKLVGDVKEFYPINEVPSDIAASINALIASAMALSDEFDRVAEEVDKRVGDDERRADEGGQPTSEDVRCAHSGVIDKHPSSRAWVCVDCGETFEPSALQVQGFFGGHRA